MILELLGVESLSLLGDLLLFPFATFNLVMPDILLGVTSGRFKFDDVVGLYVIFPFFCDSTKV